MKRRVMLALSTTVAVAIALTGCATGGGAAPEGDDTIRIAFIQKQGDQQYFVDEAEGAKAEAESQGNVEVEFFDVGLDSNAAISAVETAIAQGFDGVAIVVPDAKIGPQVADLLNEANIPFVAVDDPFEDADGNRVPWVSIDSLTMGKQVGEKAGELYAEAGWTADNTRILSALKEDLGVCVDRETGALETFEAAAGEVPDVIRVGSDNSFADSQDRTAATLTANPEITNWVVIGCNDETVTGATAALENAGFGADNVIGVGLGAYLMCKDWRAGKVSGNKASLFIDGRVDGGASVRVLVENIRDGVDLPAETLGKALMVDADTWEEAGVICT